MANGNDLAARVRRITGDLDYASQLTSVISELNLSDEDAKTYFSTIDSSVMNQDIRFITALSEIARYEGFNPRQMMSMLFKSHKDTATAISQNDEAFTEIKTNIEIDGIVSEFKFTNNMAFMSDMEFICLMFITRGAAYEKIMKKSGDTMENCMKMMRAKYNINVGTRRPGSSLDSKIVTIPRIAATFPNVTINLFHKGFGRLIFDKNLLFPGVEVPRALLSPMMPSMLPKVNDVPLAVMLAVAVKTDDVLHQVTNKTSLQALYQYMIASYSSAATTERVKCKYAVEWGLGIRSGLNQVFSYNDSVKGLRSRAKDSIRESRPHDGNLESILNLI